jgi:hypothetical protein
MQQQLSAPPPQHQQRQPGHEQGPGDKYPSSREQNSPQPGNAVIWGAAGAWPLVNRPQKITGKPRLRRASCSARIASIILTRMPSLGRRNMLPPEPIFRAPLRIAPSATISWHGSELIPSGEASAVQHVAMINAITAARKKSKLRSGPVRQNSEMGLHGRLFLRAQTLPAQRNRGVQRPSR